MELTRIYKFIDAKYSPIIGYLSISPIEEIKELLVSIQNKSGIMHDYFGFEFEDDDTLTFYDFSSKQEKNINISIQELIEFIEPILNEYLGQNMSEKDFVEVTLKNIQLS